MTGPLTPSDISSRSSKSEVSGQSQQPGNHLKQRKVDHQLTDSRPISRSSANADSRKGIPGVAMAQESDSMNEESPLLPPQTVEDVEIVPPLETVSSPSGGSDDNWLDDGRSEPDEESKSSWYMFLLTFCMLGLQFAWSVEFSNGSPYLLNLGISKSLLAFVWIAGPLSGTLVQPYVGIKSDRCRSRFGRRRPFMVGGGIATVISLLALARSRELVSSFLGIFGVSEDSKGVNTTAIVFAVLMVYVLDFSINVIQAGIRAFIVDSAPTHQQDSANAWASRVSGVGNIIGYLFGYVDLPRYLGFFGDTQFKILSLVASFAVMTTLAVSTLSIQERDPRLEGEPDRRTGGVLTFFKDLYRSIRKLPPQISRVCQVQFFAWIGWFPFLFYTTTYISEIYVEPYYAENPDMTQEEIERVWQRGTRMGTLALFVFAIVTFVASVLLPFFIASSYKGPTESPGTPMTSGASRPMTPVSPNDTNGSPGFFDQNPTYTNTSLRSSKATLWSSDSSRNALSRLTANLPSPEIPWLTLRRAWLLSHILFALLTTLTFLIRTTTGATILISLIGIPWAMTNWAPFALIAAEISKRESIRRGLLRPPPTRDGELLAQGEDPSEGADQAGVVLGIHNVAIAAPQAIASVVSSVIFRSLQKPRGSVGDESVAWVLRFGGCAALVAAWLTRRVAEEKGS